MHHHDQEKPTLMRLLRRAGALTALVSLGALALGCEAGGARNANKAAPRSQAADLAKTQQALAGVDGAGNVMAANTILNQYTALAANAALGATSIRVTSVAALAKGADALGPGDLLLVMQMQGATLNLATNDNTWGQVTALGGAGLYELVEVTAVDAATNSVTLSCALRNAYDSAGAVQVVRVPQFDTLTIAAGASITAPAWNGTTGGVVAVHAKTTITLTGDINVNALGFRGGPADNASAAQGVDTNLFFSINNADGGRKGEGVGGLLVDYGRGPSANGGGGGNAHNGGGGGGANAKSGLAWTGEGVIDASVKGGAAWALDPSFAAFGSQGGGRGGYTYSANNLDATMIAPGNAGWGGNLRRERGGLGGHALDNDPTARIFMGGGGGAGDGNDGHAGRGGNGGGIVILVSQGSITGGGRILANGEAGVDANSTLGGSTNGDSPGGGGGGGTIVVRAATASGFSVQANGGGGGNQIVNNGNEAEGPGGGGGGGFVSVSATVTASIAGGLGGTTSSPALAEFPNNGATQGSAGQTEFGVVGAVPYCVDTTIPDTTILTHPTNPTADVTGDFTFSSNDAAATFQCSVDGAAFVNCAATFATAALAEGSHTISVRARDVVGNVDATPATFSWVVDLTAPDTAIATKPNNPSSSNTGTFTFTSEPGASFECSLDSGAFAACPASFTTPTLGDGTHTLSVRARDAAGNVDPTPAVDTWVVDTQPPDTAIATKPNDPSSSNVGTFTFTSEAGATFECSLDNAAFAVCSTPFTTPALSDGSHTFSVRAKDAAGNVDPTPATFTWLVALDSDGDGLPDSTEVAIGTDPHDPDSDDDGVLDGAEPSPGADSDGDGLINALDPDSDNDGILDGTELGVTTAPPGTDVSRGHFVPDADPSTTTNPLDPDTDHGGVHDGAEDPNHNGRIDAGERDPNDPADDVTAPADDDHDGLSNDEEIAIGTNPHDADSDDDGVLDGAEPNPSDDTDGDGLINALDPDSDNDGLFDGTEMGLGCSNPDTNVARKLCIADADSGQTKTSPLKADTDGGGVRDGSEDTNLNGVVDTGETDPTLGHASDDASVVDSDHDGLSDGLERTLRSNPNDADSDDDGVPDGAEPNPSADADGDGLVDVLDVDSDNDGLFDGTEMGLACNNPDTDLSLKHCRPDADPSTMTSALDPDSDHGGVKDGSEDANLNGRVDSGEPNPVRGHAADDASVIDSDGDGLSNATEATLGSNPNDADSDDDGLLDGDEPNPSDDRDGDGLIDILDPDSDGDGLFDGTEAGKDCANPATDTSKNVCIADADQGATTTLVLVADTDHGGVVDGAEDTNHDGAREAGERDPLNPADDSTTPAEGGAGGESGAGPGAGGEAGAAAAGGAPEGGVSAGGSGANAGFAGAAASNSGGANASGGSSAQSGAAGSNPKVVVLGGGLCAYGPTTAGNAAGLMLLAAACVGVLRRRKRTH